MNDMRKLNFQYLLILTSLVVLVSCQQEPSLIVHENPGASGFNVEASDAQAIEIADNVMQAMGGRKAWDTSRFIQWTFFGRRIHIWDKLEHRARIDVPSDSLTVIFNLKDQTGRVKSKGVEITHPDSVLNYVGMAYRWWINDSYWLVMPFKLKDSGVTLKYLGESKTTLEKQAELLELTFQEVGVTPDNKYWIYVDPQTKLVTQWDYFPNYADTIARFQSPWPDYQQYGDLLLSGGQIAGNKLTGIAVSQSVKGAPFESL